LSDLDTKGLYFINNTIVDAGASGIFYNSRDASGPRGNIIHVFYNNLIVDPTTVYSDAGSFWKKSAEAFIDYNDKEQKDGATLDKNLLSRDKSAIKFADAANRNFSILSGSQAIDFGRDVSSIGVTYDINNGSRPFGAGFDAGAYEFGATNIAPIADAGNEKSITVGETANLNGSASSDPDGTISQYTWTQVSGPSTPTINSSTSAQASVTIQTSGTYVFKLTVKDNDGAIATDEVTVSVADVVLGILNRYSSSDHIASIYPNPASPTDGVVVKFTLNRPTDVSMELYSMTGSLLTKFPKLMNATHETTAHLDLKDYTSQGQIVVLMLRTSEGIAAKRILIKD